MQHFKTLSDYFEYMELPRPEHPMFSVMFAEGEDFLPCPKESSPPITNDCYTISLKKVVEGDLNYGRSKYDFTNGAMFFISPRQVLQWNKGVVFEQKGFSINFHEDFIKGTELAHELKKYGFFSYSANEALHLSPAEEQQMEAIVRNIEIEYNNNQDAFSKEIIIAHLSTLLKYANRYYERQFINRKEMSNELLDQFNTHLEEYFLSGELQELGVPSMGTIPAKLSVTQRYLSDTLKKETGKTTTEHLHLFLVDEAKNLLLVPNASIAETAYQLGFEYPQYFSRLFKKKVGMSPKQFIESQSMN